MKLETGTPLERTCLGAAATPRTVAFLSCRPAPSLVTCTSSFTTVFWPRGEAEMVSRGPGKTCGMGPAHTRTPAGAWGPRSGRPAPGPCSLHLAGKGTGGPGDPPARAGPDTHILGKEDDLCVGPTLERLQALPVVPEQLSSGLPVRGQGCDQGHGLLSGLRGCEAKALEKRVTPVTISSLAEASRAGTGRTLGWDGSVLQEAGTRRTGHGRGARTPVASTPAEADTLEDVRGPRTFADRFLKRANGAGAPPPGTAADLCVLNPHTLSSLPGALGSDPLLDSQAQVAGPGTCRGMMCPARRWRLMVSSGARSVTHCPLLWMAGVTGAGGGRLPRASAGTWRVASRHQEWEPRAPRGAPQAQPRQVVGTEALIQGLGRSRTLGELESWGATHLGLSLLIRKMGHCKDHVGRATWSPTQGPQASSLPHVAHTWQEGGTPRGPAGLTVCRSYHVPAGK